MNRCSSRSSGTPASVSTAVRRAALLALPALLLASLFVVLSPALPTHGAPAAGAQAPPSWSTGTWGGMGTTAVIETVDGPTTLQVTDYQCSGDRFSVLVDGVAVGTTSEVPPPDECTNDAIDAACALDTFSSGSFAIPAGRHTVEIRHESGFVSGFVAYRFGPAACDNSVPGSAPLAGLTALCIEDDYVQTNAQGRRVGSVIAGPPDQIVIATGPPTCSFNCIDGFDIDCDGTIGDFCPVELDRTLVDNVRPCLAAQNPATAVQQPAGPVDDSGSVPPLPIAVTVATPSLAHTGAETEALAFTGAGFLGAGAVCLVASRRRRTHRRTIAVEHRPAD